MGPFYLQDGSEAAMLIGISAVAATLPACPQSGCADAPKVVPLERWDIDASTTAARFGSFVAGAQNFDAATFGISRQASLKNSCPRTMAVSSACVVTS